jgi:hypothetical protein
VSSPRALSPNKQKSPAETSRVSLRVKKLCRVSPLVGGARGGEARLEWNLPPRKACAAGVRRAKRGLLRRHSRSKSIGGIRA